MGQGYPWGKTGAPEALHLWAKEQASGVLPLCGYWILKLPTRRLRWALNSESLDALV